MANKKIRMRPEGTNDYGDVLHPETTASQVIQETNLRFMTDAERSKLAGISTGANNYVHPTTAGNKHIPAGGSAGQFLAYGGSSGTAKWEDIMTERILITSIAGNKVIRYVDFAQGYTLGTPIYYYLNKDLEKAPSVVIPANSSIGAVIGTIATAQPIDLTGWSAIELKTSFTYPNFPLKSFFSISTSRSTNYVGEILVYEGSNIIATTIPINLVGSYYLRVHFTGSTKEDLAHPKLLEMILRK